MPVVRRSSRAAATPGLHPVQHSATITRLLYTCSLWPRILPSPTIMADRAFASVAPINQRYQHARTSRSHGNGTRPGSSLGEHCVCDQYPSHLVTPKYDPWTALSGGYGGILLARLLLGAAEAPSFPLNSKAVGHWLPRAFNPGLYFDRRELGAHVHRSTRLRRRAYADHPWRGYAAVARQRPARARRQSVPTAALSCRGAS